MKSKPHVILNCAMSLDGKIGGTGKRMRFSSEKDKLRVHELRSKVDGIMVGINTILIDDPKLTAHHAKKKKNPVRIIVDSRAKIPSKAKILQEEGKVIIAVSQRASPARVEGLKKKGARVISTGDNQVDLKNLLERVPGKIKTILLEGGGTLNKSMLENGLVDEIYVALAPRFLGEGISMVNGELSSEIKMNLLGVNQFCNEVILHYKL